jgi:hypothetical protein
MKSFNIQEHLHRKSKREAHASFLIDSFPKISRTPSEASPEASQFGGSHNYKTKQNKLPSFIDRLSNTTLGLVNFLF